MTLVLVSEVRVSEARADLEAAYERLVAGDAETAARLLSAPLGNPRTASPARAGLATVAALSGTEVLSGVDAPSLALTPLARRELAAGRVDAALRLAELGARGGRPIDPWVEAASRIEAGQAESVVLPAGPPATRLAREVRAWLEGDRRSDGVVLRDRRGEVFGRAVGELLELFDGVDEGWIPAALTDAVRGVSEPGSVRTTLDLELSRIALEALGRFRGSVVLLDPGTGEIFAAVSDAKTRRLEGGTPAFEQMREPASVQKLLTTAAFLRAGLDPDRELRGKRCRGHEEYGGELLYCPFIAGRLRGLDRAMGVSCNVAFADLGVALGRGRMIDELRRWGFDRPFGRLPGGVIHPPRGDRELADLSIGLENSEMTPLHGALIAATVAGDGRMPHPHLVAADDGLLGLHPRPRPVPPGRSILDPEWLAPLRSAMETVVDRGTARGVSPRGFPVAMKTGTASHPRHGFHVNYVGYGPRVDARIAFEVRITHQGTSRQVRYVAKLVTGRLLRRLARVAEERGWTVPPEALPIRLASVRSEADAEPLRRGQAPTPREVRTSRVATAPR